MTKSKIVPIQNGRTDNESEQNQAGSAPFLALCEALLRLRTTDECRSFLADLCTPGEIDALAERWLIARLLDQGNFSYRDINALTGASTTTIGRVARFLQQERNEGYRIALERMKNDQQ